MSKILIASREQAINILKNKKYNKQVTAIISINDRHIAAPSPVIDSQKKQDKIVLVLHFDDMGKAMVNNPRCSGWEPPKEKHVVAIIKHAEQILNSGGIILCHCNAGISRSSAAAFILKSIELGVGHEKEALASLLKDRNFISPNPWMIEMADELLGEEWHLTEALNGLRTNREGIIMVKDNTQDILENKTELLSFKNTIKRI